MPILRFKISSVFVFTALAALIVTGVLFATRPVCEIQFRNSCDKEISNLSMLVTPLLGNDVGEQFLCQSVAPGRTVSFRHDKKYPQLDFQYVVDGRQLKYENLDLSGRNRTLIQTTAKGEWAGAGRH